MSFTHSISHRAHDFSADCKTEPCYPTCLSSVFSAALGISISLVFTPTSHPAFGHMTAFLLEQRGQSLSLQVIPRLSLITVQLCWLQSHFFFQNEGKTPMKRQQVFSWILLNWSQKKGSRLNSYYQSLQWKHRVTPVKSVGLQWCSQDPDQDRGLEIGCSEHFFLLDISSPALWVILKVYCIQVEAGVHIMNFDCSWFIQYF